MAATQTPVKKTAKAAKKTASTVSVPSFTVKGEKVAAVTLDHARLTEPVDAQLLAQAVRVYRSAQRQGGASTKTRGEVTGSTRKIYRQKGTGKARHGSITAPIFVGGGIVFGPRPRDYTLQLPKKMQQRALSQALADRIKTHQVSIVSGLGSASGKTKDMSALLTKMDVKAKKLLLVIDSKMKKARLGARNLENVAVRPVQSVSLMDILNADHIILAQEATADLLARLPKAA